MRNIVTWLSILLHLDSCYGPNWCAPEFGCYDSAGRARKHILCHILPGPGECQSQTFDVKSQILELHNELRRKISTESFEINNGLPKACPMSDLVWDDELALIADRLALSCLTNREGCRGTTKFKLVGLNFRSRELGTYDIKQVVKLMFDGWSTTLLTVKGTRDVLRDYRPGSWSIGTQMVWAETTSIGCALAIYRSPPRASLMHGLTCNYAPAGNTPHKKVYQTDNCHPITVPPPTTTTTARTTTPRTTTTSRTTTPRTTTTSRTTTPRTTTTARTTTTRITTTAIAITPGTTTTASTKTPGITTTARTRTTASTTSANATGTTTTTTDVARSSLTFTGSSISTSSTVASSNVTEANSDFLPLLYPTKTPIIVVIITSGREKVYGNSNLLGAAFLILLTLGL